MMPVINGMQALSIAAALAKAGAKWTPLFRQPADANGVPTGEPVRIGCLLGMSYRKGQSSVVRVAIPGVAVGQDVLRFEGVLASGCGEPQEGDLLCAGPGGERVKIAHVMKEAPPLMVLTLEE